MSRIIWQTDDWRGELDEKCDHIEIEWPEGYSTFITISDKSITIHSDTFLKVVEPSALNKLVISHGA